MEWRFGRGEPVVRKSREEARAIVRLDQGWYSDLWFSCPWAPETWSVKVFRDLSAKNSNWVFLSWPELIKSLSVLLICRSLTPPLEGTPALSSQLSGLAQNQAQHHSTHEDAQVEILLGVKYCECSIVESLNFVCSFKECWSLFCLDKQFSYLWISVVLF